MRFTGLNEPIGMPPRDDDERLIARIVNVKLDNLRLNNVELR